VVDKKDQVWRRREFAPFVKIVRLGQNLRGELVYIWVDWTYAGQVLDPIKAGPEAALQKLSRSCYFRLAA